MKNSSIGLGTGHRLSRARLALGSALGGTLALMALAAPDRAQAADECGVVPLTGAVVCTPLLNPLTTGVTYVAPATDLTLTLQDGVVIDTTGTANSGIVVNSANAVTVNGGTNTSIVTDGLAANGVLAVNLAAPTTITLDEIATSGVDAIGVSANSATGPIAVTTNLVTTTGDGAIGILAQTGGAGAVTINSGTVSTGGLGATGISATTDTGALLVTSGPVTTLGNNADAITATSTGGTASVVGTGAISTSGDNSSGIVASGATGVTVTDPRAITTAGLASTGVDAFSATGPVAVTVGNITTTGDGSLGLRAEAGGTGTVTATTGTISTSGADALAISATSDTGAVAVNAGTLSTLGVNADAIDVTSTSGAVTVNANGNITTAGDNANAIDAATGGAGTLTITSGTINTSGAGSTALTAETDTGALTVTAGTTNTLGLDADAINAVSTGGSVTVNANGNISTAGDNAAGILASAASGATVTSNSSITTAGADAVGVDVSSAAGPVAVTLRNVTTTGNGSEAVVVNAGTGPATVTVTGALRTSGSAADALTVGGGGNAVVNLAAGASFSTVDGDYLQLNSAGTTTVNTAATIGNNASGYAVVATGGPVILNNSGSLRSDILLSGGADVVNNSGAFVVGVNPDFGAGVDTFNNSGTVSVLAGTTAPVARVFTGLEAFNNSGTIDLRNGRAGDTLTLPGTYAGANGTLGLDVTGNVADQLIVGGAATGTTTIVLNQSPGDAVLNPGTLLVNAGAGSSAAAFDLLNGGIDAGFVRYDVVYDAPNTNFMLVAAPSDAAFRTLNYAEGVRSLWLKSADAVSAQLRERRDAQWTRGGGDTTGRFWVQIHGSKENRDALRDFTVYGQTRQADMGFSQDYYGGQMGLDIGGSAGDRGGFAFGVTGGYLNSSQHFTNSADRVDFDVVNLGLYGSFSSGNLFFNALGKYDRYWAKARVPSAGFRDKSTGDVYGARAEVGMRFGSDTFFVEPAASISYVKSDVDNLQSAGFTIAFDDDDGLRGRLGARVGGIVDIGGPKMSVYGGLNYVHEFQGRDKVTFTSGGQTLTYTNRRLRDYGEAILGATIAQNEAVSGFFEANYLRTFSDSRRGELDGYGARAGVRFRF